jgi:tRNA-modifying protein YgfZ
MSEAASTRASFGDVTAEYRALREGAGLVSGARELVWVTGPQSLEFLDGQLSQDLGAIPAGGVARSFLLEPRGKLLALLWVLRADDRVGLIADAGKGEVTAAALQRFKFRVDADIVTPPIPVLELWGAGAGAVLGEAGLPVPAGWVDADGVVVAAASAGVSRFMVAGADVASLLDAGAVPVGSLARTTVRIEIGEPVMGIDVDESTIPHESGLVEDSVSFTKGCFVGQELVARIDSRGRVNRLLRGLVITENVIPPEGAELSTPDREVGRITSVGESLTVRAPVALGMVRREVEPGETVRVVWPGGETTAEVRELPLVAA